MNAARHTTTGDHRTKRQQTKALAQRCRQPRLLPQDKGWQPRWQAIPTSDCHAPFLLSVRLCRSLFSNLPRLFAVKTITRGVQMAAKQCQSKAEMTHRAGYVTVRSVSQVETWSTARNLR